MFWRCLLLVFCALLLVLLIAAPAHVANAQCTDPTDSDGDGWPNCNDQCPFDPAPNSPIGCPPPTEPPPPSPTSEPVGTNEPPPQPTSDGSGQPPTNDDRDGDGTPNGLDQCPDVGGPSSANGCPVSDQSLATQAPLPALISADGSCVGATRTAQAVNVRVNPATSAALAGALDPSQIYSLSSAVQVGDQTWYALAEPLGFIASWVVRSSNCDQLPLFHVGDSEGTQRLSVSLITEQLGTVDLEISTLLNQLAAQRRREGAAIEAVREGEESAQSTAVPAIPAGMGGSIIAAPLSQIAAVLAIVQQVEAKALEDQAAANDRDAGQSLSVHLEAGVVVYQLGAEDAETLADTVQVRISLLPDPDEVPCDDANSASPCGILANFPYSAGSIPTAQGMPFGIADADADGLLTLADLPGSDTNALDLWVGDLDGDAAADVSSFILSDLDGDGSTDLIGFSWGAPDSNGLLPMPSFGVLDSSANGVLDSADIPITDAEDIDSIRSGGFLNPSSGTDADENDSANAGGFLSAALGDNADSAAEAGSLKAFIIGDFDADGVLEARYVGVLE